MLPFIPLSLQRIDSKDVIFASSKAFSKSIKIAKQILSAFVFGPERLYLASDAIFVRVAMASVVPLPFVLPKRLGWSGPMRNLRRDSIILSITLARQLSKAMGRNSPSSFFGTGTIGIIFH